MDIIIVGKNIDVTTGLRSVVEDKLSKLEKYFTQETTIHVTMKADKGRHKIEVTIPLKGRIIRAEQVSEDMYQTIDLVEEVIERQLKKYKNKLINRKHQADDYFRPEYIEKEYEDEDDEVQIERVKHFEMKPMFIEDACVQMELLGHNFYVFINAETDETNVVYKRKNGGYGLIEPEA